MSAALLERPRSIRPPSCVCSPVHVPSRSSVRPLMYCPVPSPLFIYPFAHSLSRPVPFARSEIFSFFLKLQYLLSSEDFSRFSAVSWPTLSWAIGTAEATFGRSNFRPKRLSVEVTFGRSDFLCRICTHSRDCSCLITLRRNLVGRFTG